MTGTTPPIKKLELVRQFPSDEAMERMAKVVQLWRQRQELNRQRNGQTNDK